jgi:branched-chain amino acid transport system ATP-binding protein
MHACARSIWASASMSDCLALHEVSAGYGETVVLEGISLAVAEGGTLAVLGRNGVGKTTLLASMLGHTTRHAGRIMFRGEPIERLRPFERVRRGIGYVPQEREIFPSLDVDENLAVAARGGTRWTREHVYALFPSLAMRRRNMGNQLSGGEQQMLAIGRALMQNPRVLLMDEPSEGLAPQIVAEVMATVKKLKDSGLSIVLVEQNPKLVFDIADDIVILNTGQVAVTSTAADLNRDGVDLRQHLGVF